MKRFISNIFLFVFGFIGFIGMTGNDYLANHFFLQLLCTAASFYLCVVCFRTLAKRLADHLPDEEC